MKLKALALILVLAGYGVANAGVDPSNTFNVGLEAGANFSTLVGSDVTTNFGSSTLSNKLGFVGGGFLCLNFGSSFGIRPEVLYEQKGVAISGTSTTTELDYFEIPVLLKFSLGTPAVNPAILIGPSFAWNTLAQSGGVNVSGVSSSDVGLVGGIEVDIDKFLVSGRYELGLDNVTQDSKIQNGTFTFLVGYSFM